MDGSAEFQPSARKTGLGMLFIHQTLPLHFFISSHLNLVLVLANTEVVQFLLSQLFPASTLKTHLHPDPEAAQETMALPLVLQQVPMVKGTCNTLIKHANLTDPFHRLPCLTQQMLRTVTLTLYELTPS